MAGRRAPLVLGATAVGVGVTLGFHAHPQAPTASGTVTTASSVAAPAASSSRRSSSSSASSSQPRTATGQAVATRYGNVQLTVTISGGKVTDIQPVQLPQTDPKSMQISSYAAPLLRQSALSKQSASVDAVSGATYTSDGYAQALQSALDRAGFEASGATASG